LTLMLAGAAAVSLLVGGVGIMNLMLVSVSERRLEIGLRMAIGARRREIGLQFLIEAGLLALLGCGAGVLLAMGGGMAFGAGPAIWNPLTGMTILAAIAAATLITVISALYRRARPRNWIRPTRWHKMRSLTHRIDPSV
jgi:putative ABC transport system permease protein